jgi:hypothetical protein
MVHRNHEEEKNLRKFFDSAPPGAAGAIVTETIRKIPNSP